MMTYDDGYVPKNIEHLLDVYKGHNVKFSCFLLAPCLVQASSLLERIIDEGHLIGCHGYDHVDFRGLTDDQLHSQFQKWMDVFQGIVPNYHVNYFRAPYGSKDKRVLRIAAEHGLQHVMWNIESGGMDDKTFSYVFDGLDRFHRYYSGSIGGAIVLSHTMRYYDISQSEAIITELIGRGYDLVTVDQGIKKEDRW